MLAMDKRSSLLQIFVNDGRKKFNNNGPCPIQGTPTENN